VRVDRITLADICRQYGPKIILLPAGVDGPTLLWAMAGVESGFGENCVPRHEPEYCPQILWHKHLSPEGEAEYIQRSGMYSRDQGQPGLFARFGCLACCSFTPWQIMAVHAALGMDGPQITPLELLNDLDKGVQAVVAFLNKKIAVLHPSDLSHFAALWNGVPSFEYVSELKKNYAAGLPASNA
jgi:hypothetical protein